MIPWVLLSGTLCMIACFAPVLAALADDDIAPPKSTFLPGDTGDPMAEATRLFETAPERFVACAFSLGGFVAFQAALTAPERLAGLILIGVTGRADPPRNAASRRARVGRARCESTAALVRDTLLPNYVAASSLHDEALRRDIEMMAASIGPDRLAHQAEIAIVRPDVIDALGSVRAPVLAIGGKADVTSPPERGAEIARALANAMHAVVADAGHFVLMERPEAAASEIAAWLRATPDLSPNVSGASPRRASS